MSEENDQKEPEESSMPFLDHMEELRWRLLKSLTAVIIMAVAAFYFSDELMKLIVIPLGEQKLYNMQVTGTFYAYLKLSLVTGIVAALPFVFYQLWMFIAPGLYRHERTSVLSLVSVSTVLFLIGAAFCFFIVLPLAFEFLTGFAGELVTNNITISSYIGFSGLLLVAFGFAFQLPVVAYFLGKMGLISSGILAKGRRYAIVAILIVGAIITPPDVFTQFLLAVPLYILYEVSIIVVRLTGLHEKEDQDEPEELAG